MFKTSGNWGYLIKRQSGQQGVNNKFQILENMEDEDNIDNNNNEKWENINTIIKETKQLKENV